MLIAINGRKQSGKDLVGKIIQYLTSESNVYPFDLKLDYSYRSNWQIKKFADKLKDIVCLLISCNKEQLEDETFKSKELGEEWWYFKGRNGTLIPYSEDSKRNDEDLIKPTPRFLMQYVGTDLLRNQLHPEIWVNSLFADYQPLSDIITSNNNFDNRLNHGYNKTKIWRTYYNIKQRCNNPKHPRYNDYGGRGIKMCKEWEDDIMNFINWAKENNYNDSLTIDRINVNQDYSPSNCRCVSYSIQSINTTTRIDNTSGYRGVSRDKHNWRAQIQIKGKSKFLGYFDTPEEASEAYENAFMEREDLYLKEEPNNLIYPSWCITDMRFLNEMEVVKKRGGITIRVNRNLEESKDQHESETELDNAEFDYVINNDGTIEELIEKVREILTKEKLI